MVIKTQFQELLWINAQISNCNVTLRVLLFIQDIQQTCLHELFQMLATGRRLGPSGAGLWRGAGLRGAKLLSSPSISASHQSAQRESEPRLQAAALNNSRACYRTPLAACQYCLCLGLFPQLLAMPERLKGEAEVLSGAHRRALSRHSACVHH